MRRPPARLVLAGLLLAAALGGAPAAAQDGAEQITAFEVALRIEPDGSLAVHERIAYDFGTTAHHGIFREIPVKERYDRRYDRVYPLRVESVSASPGTPSQYTVSTAGGSKVIRIGDPNRTVTGAHTYLIDYRVEHVLNAFPDHDELYWNVTGNRWEVPIQLATAALKAPTAVTQVACYAGPAGSRLSCAQHGTDSDAALFVQPGLGPHEGLTVVAAIPSGVVPKPVPLLQERWSLDRAFSRTPATVGVAGALLAAVVAGFVALAWRTGRDRRYAGSGVEQVLGGPDGAEQAVPFGERPVTPVEFAPPDGLRPGQVGTLVDERANPIDVIATVVDLAVRGYLRIEEIPKEGWFGKPDWRLVKLQKAGDDLRHYEALLFGGIFKAGDTVLLSSLKNTFAKRLQSVQDALYADAVKQRWFTARPDRVRTKWVVIGGALLVAAGLITLLLAARTHAGLLGLPLIVGAALVLAGSSRMPRRTARGTAVVRRVLGFRRFIAESEADRARFAERQNLFSEYALRHRLRLHREVGAGLRRHRRRAARDGVVRRLPPVHGGDVRVLHGRVHHHHGGHHHVHAVGVGEQRLRRRGVLRRRRGRGRRGVVVTRPRRSSVLLVLAALVVSGVLIAVIAAVSGDDGGGAAAAGEGCGAAARSRAILACVSPSLAFVSTPAGTGSGILIAGRYVLTNAHVVDPYSSVDLVFEGDERHDGVPVKAADFYADLALVGPVDTERPALAVHDYDQLQRGDDVYLVGYPGEVDDDPDPTISRGILSRVRRAHGYGLTFLQTDASIGGGQSGGALVDGDGRVVGVSGFSFADEFALALSGPDTRRSVGAMEAGATPPYRPFPDGGSRSGSFRLTDDEDTQVLTLRTGGRARTVRLTLPADTRPAVYVSDLSGDNVFFQNREAVDAAAEAGDDTQVDDGDIGAPVAPGVFEFEVPASTDALVLLGTRLPGGASVAWSSTVPLGQFDDTDDDRPVRVGDRVEGVVDALEVGGDSFDVDLGEGQQVEVFAGSPTGNVEFEVREPGQKGKDASFVDDSGLGLFGADAQDTFTARTAGIHRITVYAADGVGTAYVLEIRPG